MRRRPPRRPGRLALPAARDTGATTLPSHESTPCLATSVTNTRVIRIRQLGPCGQDLRELESEVSNEDLRVGVAGAWPSPAAGPDDRMSPLRVGDDFLREPTGVVRAHDPDRRRCPGDVDGGLVALPFRNRACWRRPDGLADDSHAPGTFLEARVNVAVVRLEGLRRAAIPGHRVDEVHGAGIHAQGFPNGTEIRLLRHDEDRLFAFPAP